MKEFSVFEAKNKLSQLIRLVSSSGPIIITNRGEPVAQIIPFQKEETIEGRFNRFEQSGRIQNKLAREGKLWKANKKPGAVARFLADRNK